LTQLTWFGFWGRLGFGKVLVGKGWFSDGVGVKVRFLSLMMEIGEEILVRLRFNGLRIW